MRKIVLYFFGFNCPATIRVIRTGDFSHVEHGSSVSWHYLQLTVTLRPLKEMFVSNVFHWLSPSPCSPQSLTFSHPPARGRTQLLCSRSWQTPPWMRSMWSPPSSCTLKVQPPSLAFTLQRTTANILNSPWWDAWTKVSTFAEIIFLRLFSYSSIWGLLALRWFRPTV